MQVVIPVGVVISIVFLFSRDSDPHGTIAYESPPIAARPRWLRAPAHAIVHSYDAQRPAGRWS